ncbi:MAG: polyphosphate polymerase domain-containing protein [Clostridia bacterium]|nr:polyphosphate polymerase domain-containing protein [Clostridia bacterium]
MKYRHEWKHEINYSDLLALRMRLSAVMKPDAHTTDGKYKIRSVYFDTPHDKALREKRDGVNAREKFRIRLYNDDTSLIKLEKKSKINGLCLKESCRLSKEEAQKLIDGDLAWMSECRENETGNRRKLCAELYLKMTTQGLRPKTIVDYIREPFTFPVGNVRVTLDYNIRTGGFRTDFLNTETVTMKAGDAPIILEVKWDEFLPAVIRDIVQLSGRHTGAFSKYAQCRIYG